MTRRRSAGAAILAAVCLVAGGRLNSVSNQPATRAIEGSSVTPSVSALRNLGPVELIDSVYVGAITEELCREGGVGSPHTLLFLLDAALPSGDQFESHQFPSPTGNNPNNVILLESPYQVASVFIGGFGGGITVNSFVTNTCPAAGTLIGAVQIELRSGDFLVAELTKS